LLAEADLPVPVEGEPDVEFVVVDEGEGVVACAGWEIHGESALLRSVAVDERVRSRGLGRAVVKEALRRLDGRGIRDLTLVTLDAERFFEPLGFEPIPRESVPPAVRASPEFRIHHCASGLWMRRLR
jgi:amino-acid N-acetyltransferase